MMQDAVRSSFMETFIGVVFMACAGLAVFVGLHKDDIEEGRVPEPVAAYWSE
jgi:hypothetical protein